MFIINKIRPRHFKRNLIDIESILQTSLKPVSPRPEFIQDLHKGLMEYTFPELESSGYDIKKPLLFALVGMAGMLVIVSLWVRLLLVILSTIGMIQSAKHRKMPN